jgi:hypothetical protein
MTFMRYAVIAALAFSLTAQTHKTEAKESYKTRLTAVPADARTRAELTGSGTATATLEGSKVTVSGSFEDLKTNATTANLHMAIAAGVRGPAIGDLTITKATSGTISGSVDLTTEQLKNMQHGGLYLEIHSEKAPDGVIWGWFLK